jgi:enoyl-CoA hydratase/carnithine racemase
MTYDQIVVDRQGPIELITLNRPEAMNAWTWRMSAELGEAFDRADADDDVRAIVVTGAGRAFCAGADLGGGGATFSGGSKVIGGADDVERARRSTPAHRLNTPVIAAINGAAVGAGLTMTVEWDLRVVADDAKLGFVFNRRGVMPDGDLLWLVPRMIGFGPAMDLLLTGRLFTGREAKELGLVHRAVPRGEVVEHALELARDIAVNTAPVSVAITKRVLYDFLTEPDRGRALAAQGELFAWTGRQADAVEGVRAFLEKRPARWQLRTSTDLPDQLSRERSGGRGARGGRDRSGRDDGERDRDPRP